MNKIIIYDFDGTLTPLPITDFKILEKCGYVGGGNNIEVIKIQNIIPTCVNGHLMMFVVMKK